MREIKELVINWHLTERCNFQCEYCFSKYAENCPSGEVSRDLAKSKQLLSFVYDYFHEKYNIPLRLSLAGGEPLLAKNIVAISNIASDIGFNVSMITNGYKLDAETANAISPYISMIGVSIDSSSSEIDAAIGRKTNSNKTLDQRSLQASLSILKQAGVTVKLNTVVNKHNVDEDLNKMIGEISPDKWKILQVLPITTDELCVSDISFNGFIKRHSDFAGIITHESNDDMTESYIMIDPKGRFFQNSQGNGYEYSDSICDNFNVEACFSQLNFNLEKFAKRY